MAAPETVHVIATANDAARTVQTLDLSMELHIADGGWSTVRLVKVADERLVWKRARQPVAFKHRELEVHRDLRHEHIVQIVYSWYERAPAGEDTAHLNLLLAPYVPLTLAQSPLPLSEPAAMQHAAQVLAALAYLHETPRSIAHRDIKPDNILVQPGRDGGATTVYLCDFGCAKRILESEQNGTEVGEQKIRAPELLVQSGYGSYSTKVDIFAAGLLFVYMLTGRDVLKARESHAEQRAEYEEVFCGAETVHDVSAVLEKKETSMSPGCLAWISHALLPDPHARAGAGDMLNLHLSQQEPHEAHVI